MWVHEDWIFCEMTRRKIEKCNHKFAWRLVLSSDLRDRYLSESNVRKPIVNYGNRMPYIRCRLFISIGWFLKWGGFAENTAEIEHKSYSAEEIKKISDDMGVQRFINYTTHNFAIYSQLRSLRYPSTSESLKLWTLSNPLKDRVS